MATRKFLSTAGIQRVIDWVKGNYVPTSNVYTGEAPMTPDDAGKLPTLFGLISAGMLQDDPVTMNDVEVIRSGIIAMIPTLTSQLTNDSGFITASELPGEDTALTNADIDAAISEMGGDPSIAEETGSLTNSEIDAIIAGA